MAINWRDIRPYNGTQNDGFEELVCQLARNEKFENQKKFIRLGKPDAGVECYWILKDGTECAWQAKFFTSAMGDSQWKQIDESVKTAIEKHPLLKRYTIAIPIDPSDGRNANQKSTLDKWNDRITTWEEWATDKGMQIQFEAWWSSDIIQKMTEPSNEGLKRFWFNKDEFSDDWFQRQNKQAIADLGKRYTPNIYKDLNVDIKIKNIFKGLSRDKALQDSMMEILNTVKEDVDIAIPLHDKLQNQKIKIEEIIETIIKAFEDIDLNSVDDIPINEFTKSLTDLNNELQIAWNFYQRAKENAQDQEAHKAGYDREIENIFNAINSINKGLDFFSKDELLLANSPYLLVEGEAGVGKSHLLADVVDNRNKKGLFSLFLLGQHFVTNEAPWIQIKKELEINCSFDVFLRALNAKAEATKNRIIIFIDALNEGHGLHFWPDHIRGFSEKIKTYPWIGLVVSVRTTYLEAIIPSDERENGPLLTVKHDGFKGIEFEATKLFFKNFGIDEPTTPYLNPEFQNPLFLLLFCEGLKKSGRSTIREGLSGINSIFNFYIESINNRLSSQKFFGYNSTLNLVQEAINCYIELLLNADNNFVRYDEALISINNITNRYGLKSGFLDSLISEGVFTKNCIKEQNEDQYFNVIFLSYERFSDHMLAKYILSKNIDLSVEFEKDGKLYNWFKDERDMSYNKGLLDALSIQIPELTGKELFLYAKHIAKTDSVAISFINSLIWRDVKKIDKDVLEYIDNKIIPDNVLCYKFFDNLLVLSAKKGNYFNSLFLHKKLKDLSMSKRDSFWTIYLYNPSTEYDSIQKLIDWARSSGSGLNVSKDVIKLSSISIAWFLTSTDRKMRDEATKALVNLLKNHIDILVEVLTLFEGVDDPYVYERLFAAAYGCSLLTSYKDDLKRLSDYVYLTIFHDKTEVYPHILLRDYARGVIEYTHYLFGELDFDMAEVRPPYHSELPAKFLTNEEIDKRYKVDSTKINHAQQNQILASMTTEYGRGDGRYGDFGRYTFQAALFPWNVNADELSNLGLEFIFEKYGYNANLHGDYDRNVFSGDGRGSEKERIGKKYQWIALHEILAKVSDNCKMKSENYGPDKKLVQYEGPWQTFVRDIDPTLYVQLSSLNQHNNESQKWWVPEEYKQWHLYNDNAEWVRDQDNVPDPHSLISIKDQNGQDWLVLECNHTWTEPKKFGESRFFNPKKQLWYQIRSYLVAKENSKALFDWARKQNFMGRWMPESYEQSVIFNSEYYWSSAYKYFKDQHNNGFEKHIIDLNDKLGNKIEITLTSSNYYWEQNDHSLNNSVRILKPSASLYNIMQLSPGKNEGEFLNQANELCCFSPSQYHGSEPLLLVKKEELKKCLDQNNLALIWTVLGNKLISGIPYQPEQPIEEAIINGAYILNGNTEKGGYEVEIKK